MIYEEKFSLQCHFKSTFLRIFFNRSGAGLGGTSQFSNWNILLTLVRTPTPAAWRLGEIRILYALTINRVIDPLPEIFVGTSVLSERSVGAIHWIPTSNDEGCVPGKPQLFKI